MSADHYHHRSDEEETLRPRATRAVGRHEAPTAPSATCVWGPSGSRGHGPGQGSSGAREGRRRPERHATEGGTEARVRRKRCLFRLRCPSRGLPRPTSRSRAVPTVHARPCGHRMTQGVPTARCRNVAAPSALTSGAGPSSRTHRALRRAPCPRRVLTRRSGDVRRAAVVPPPLRQSCWESDPRPPRACGLRRMTLCFAYAAQKGEPWDGGWVSGRSSFSVSPAASQFRLLPTHPSTTGLVAATWGSKFGVPNGRQVTAHPRLLRCTPWCAVTKRGPSRDAATVSLLAALL